MIIARDSRNGLVIVFWFLLPVAVLSQDRVATPKGNDTSSLSASTTEGITREQAGAILDELRQIRRLLEKQERQAAMAPNAAAPPSQTVQMSVGSGWYSLGRTDAPLTLVEFGDYQCPFCKRFHKDAYTQLKKQYIDTGKVRFVSRDLPMDFHPFAMKAAEAARCAGDQGHYWELHDALYAAPTPPDDEGIRKAAADLALDTKRLQLCLDSGQHKSDIQADMNEAAALEITGTPTFVLAKTEKDKLNGIRIVGALPVTTFQSAIDSLLKNEMARP